MGMMDAMVRSMKPERREQMMIDMMPQMMEGMDINELMPKMMARMLQDITLDDVMAYLKKTLDEQEKLKAALESVREANPMQRMMFRTYASLYSFEETVQRLVEAAPQNGWRVAEVRDLQNDYREVGIEGATPMKIVYLCNPEGGWSIIREDDRKPMSVMMPTGVSVYRSTRGTTVGSRLPP